MADEPTGFNAANQATGTNWHYDARGNLDAKPGVGGAARFLYNGENMVIAACPSDPLPQNCAYNTSSGRTTYGYDGEGRRVTRNDSAGTTTFVYDADGQLAVAYGGAGAATGTTWLTDDQLGSTRVVTDAGGSVVSRLDYLPFGEEIPETVRNARSGVVGYSSDGGVKVKFTGKERDAETGLDYFGARYMSSAQGRFTSADEPLVDQSAGDPQSWNLYSYVRNNPLKFTDPTGQDCVYTNNLSSNGTVGVERGDCSQSGGTFVNGTIDTSSLNYNQRKSTLSYSYSNGDTIGSGVIGGLPPPVQFPGIEGPANRAGAAHIGASQSLINGFMAADAAFATAYLGTYAIPAAIGALQASSEIGAIGSGVGPVEEFVGKFRQGSIKQAQGWTFNGLTVRQALEAGARKLPMDASTRQSSCRSR